MAEDMAEGMAEATLLDLLVSLEHCVGSRED